MTTSSLTVGRLGVEDDLMHPVSADASHNESMFFNFFDNERGSGGFVRIGNRPNEGHAEMTFCVFLADGSMLFQWGRPAISGNDELNAAGLRFEVLDPGKLLHIEFTGDAVHLTDPLQMSNPGEAMRSSPKVPTELVLTCRATSPMVGSASGSPSAVIFLDGVGHYQQACAYDGHVAHAGTRTPVQALGVRDHSWGRRVWQDLFMDRSYWVCFGEDLTFIACKTWNDKDRAPDEMGCVIDDGDAFRLRKIGLVSRFAPGTARHSGLTLDLEDERGKQYRLEAEALTYVPLRHRKPGHPIVHLGQAMSRYTLDGRSKALGLSEYFDAEESTAAIEASLDPAGIPE
jgi:hypothetical protein